MHLISKSGKYVDWNHVQILLIFFRPWAHHSLWQMERKKKAECVSDWWGQLSISLARTVSTITIGETATWQCAVFHNARHFKFWCVAALCEVLLFLPCVIYLRVVDCISSPKRVQKYFGSRNNATSTLNRANINISWGWSHGVLRLKNS